SSDPAGESAGSSVERRSVPLPVPGQVVEYADNTGRKVLAAASAVEGRQMSVLVELPRNQAYAPLHQLRNLTFALVALLLLVIGSVAYFLGQAIVRPLARLTSGASEVAAGDFSVDLPMIGGGEVNDLTEVFNDMVRDLRDGRRALDEAHEELMERNVELERLSITDGLTDLINRRRGMEILHEEIRRCDRYDVPMSLLMVDVDHFKRYNDTHGHLEGDMVLRGVSKAIKQATRGVDTASRFGGEEFMVLLPECDADGAMEAARRMRERLAREEFRGGHVTMSVGAAVYPLHADHPEGLIAAADAALYQAKDAGRDRAVLAAVDRGTAPDGQDPIGPAVGDGSASEPGGKATGKKPSADKRSGKKAPAKKSAASNTAD
ncbi:MAG: diguanylate cyclase, partial [Gemmatimonadota bacterium]|nr:diguanylate cyclase [Gemmatimonadota bacterium]